MRALAHTHTHADWNSRDIRTGKENEIQVEKEKAIANVRKARTKKFGEKNPSHSFEFIIESNGEYGASEK